MHIIRSDMRSDDIYEATITTSLSFQNKILSGVIELDGQAVKTNHSIF